MISLSTLEHVEHVSWAHDLARRLLAEPLPTRWAHTEGVAWAARTIAHAVGADASLLIDAAWLHDIGYAPDLAMTGLHPLDGARYLQMVAESDTLLCRLVANHSCAIVEARHRGLVHELAEEFPAVDGLVADALTYCDMTTSPNGRSVPVEERLREIVARYGNGDVVAESIRQAGPKIIDTVRRIEALI